MNKLELLTLSKCSDLYLEKFKDLRKCCLILLVQTHPNISEVEKKKVCSLMDCKKLSRDVYAHAAQNDRFQENLSDSDSPAPATAEKTLSPPELSSYKNELSKLNRENQYLKLELLKVKMKFKELEKEKAFEVM